MHGGELGRERSRQEWMNLKTFMTVYYYSSFIHSVSVAGSFLSCCRFHIHF